jgi:hypothetical protein
MAKKSSIAADGPSPLMKTLAQQLDATNKSYKKIAKAVGFEMVSLEPETEGSPSLRKSLLNILDGTGKNGIERLAFEVDPSQKNVYSSLYEAKTRLIPDTILKRISIQDDLVAAIVQARANHVGAHGTPRADRFSIGFVLDPKPGVLDNCNEEQKKDLRERIKTLVEKVSTCGSTKGWSDDDKMTFTQYLYMSTRDAVTVGRVATEIIYAMDKDGQKRPHSFRPIDAGTIYRAAPQKTAAETVRQQAKGLLEQLKGKKLVPEKFQNDEYAWVQVINGKPVQAFTADEVVVHNFYPVTHVEMDGYPLTPLDTVISAVTTHINIATHNRMYFQTGRATRGMLVIRSDDMDEGVIARIRQQFNASINSVNNSWRMPVFGVGTEDEISWQSIDGGGKDAEFQYLSDSNCRTILSAYQMSPEELPGYGHLSRGTNSQALSEGNQEYKLQAARDVGIRPLIKQWEEFLNAAILPVLDPILSKLVTLRLLGLDAETAEKESIRLQQDMPVHMTMDEVLDHVEKDPVGKEWGGDFLVNPQWQAILDNHSGLTVGEIAAHFLGRPELAKRPDLQYVRDPMWFQWQQLMQAQQQMQMQQQQMAQQQQAEAQQQQAAAQPGQDQQQDPQQGQQQPQQQEGQGEELTRSLDQAIGLLTKSEKQLPPGKRKLLAQHKATVARFMDAWEKDIQDASAKILELAEAETKKD